MRSTISFAQRSPYDGHVRLVVALATLCACGRLGFAPVDDAPTPKAGDAAGGDGPPPADSPAGMGDYTVTQTTGAYVPLAGAPVPGFAAGADDENYSVALPFTFVFYGVPYTSVTVSVNGYLTFGPPASGSDTTSNDCPLDGTAPDAVIAVFWDDLDAGTISYAVTGSAPDRQLTVEWKDMDAYYVAGNGNNAFTQGIAVTQQVTLHETGAIEMRYGPRTAPTNVNQDCGADRHRGCSATVGLEAPASTVFDTVQCGTAAGPGPGYTPIDEGRVITFTPI